MKLDLLKEMMAHTWLMWRLPNEYWRNAVLGFMQLVGELQILSGY
jgi:hypothetical protein